MEKNASTAENIDGEIKQKGKRVFELLLLAAYLVLLIRFVLKPITEFLIMCEDYVRLYILNYFFK